MMASRWYEALDVEGRLLQGVLEAEELPSKGLDYFCWGLQ